MTAGLFWFCALGLGYLYLGYPALMALLARWFPAPERKQPMDAPVSVLVVGYNEATNLPRKIQNILASEGPARIDEVLVASDGSDDGTEQAVHSLHDPRVRLRAWPQRRGKPSVLNDTVPACRNDFVVLTDARQDLHPQAISKLIANFADDRVGVVSGELVFRETAPSSPTARGVGVYWRYEKFIRRQESRFGSVPGATGALYAIRKKLFVPLPADALLDDVVVPMQAVSQGYRCVFEAGALVYDQPSREPRQESIRKRRTIAGNAQLIRLFPEWLRPGKNPVWFSFVSHKLLRLLSPFLLAGAALTSAALTDSALYLICLGIQVVFYALAAAGWILQRAGRRAGPLAAPLVFVSLNITTLLAWWDALRGRFTVTWERAPLSAG